VRPGVRFLVSHPAHAIALGFGSGLAPFAPGTCGTLLGWLSFDLLEPWLSPWLWIAILPASFFLGVWACGRTGRDLGVADHGAMVWDEIVAMWLVLLFTPAGLAWQAIAFVLFRVFDVTKPWPIGWLDRRVKGGLGVMIDDTLAAVYAIATLLVMTLAWERWHG
jgi:phosphatidylglycerophosphatase A